MTYGDWSAAWWQWALAIPASGNPINDPTGALCAVGQSTGPVFYLAGGTDITRHCTIPAGKTLVFPIINSECSNLEAAPWYGGNGQELRTCAGWWGDFIEIDSLAVMIDGKKVKNLGYFRAQSPVFDFVIPDTTDNFLGVDPAVVGTHGISVSDGYWVIVEPLSPGHHVIHFEGVWKPNPVCANCYQRMTYHLTVTK
jgi:hypothetical protein